MNGSTSRRFRDRPTGEILVLSITFTVCFGILGSGLLVGVVVLTNPDADVSTWVSRITGILNTMVGLLAGYLAGRTDTVVQREAPAEEGP